MKKRVWWVDWQTSFVGCLTTWLACYLTLFSHPIRIQGNALVAVVSARASRRMCVTTQVLIGLLDYLLQLTIFWVLTPVLTLIKALDIFLSVKIYIKFSFTSTDPKTRRFLEPLNQFTFHRDRNWKKEKWLPWKERSKILMFSLNLKISKR